MPVRLNAKGATDMARKPSKAAKKARKKPAKKTTRKSARKRAKKPINRKKRMSRPGKIAPKVVGKMARRKPAKPAAAHVSPASKPSTARKHSPDTTTNALALLVLIMIVLASGYFYLHNQPGGDAMAQPAAVAMEKK
jgi:hypothetical protein